MMSLPVSSEFNSWYGIKGRLSLMVLNIIGQIGLWKNMKKLVCMIVMNEMYTHMLNFKNIADCGQNFCWKL